MPIKWRNISGCRTNTATDEAHVFEVVACNTVSSEEDVVGTGWIGRWNNTRAAALLPGSPAADRACTDIQDNWCAGRATKCYEQLCLTTTAQHADWAHVVSRAESPDCGTGFHVAAFAIKEPSAHDQIAQFEYVGTSAECAERCANLTGHTCVAYKYDWTTEACRMLGDFRTESARLGRVTRSASTVDCLRTVYLPGQQQTAQQLLLASMPPRGCTGTGVTAVRHRMNASRGPVSGVLAAPLVDAPRAGLPPVTALVPVAFALLGLHAWMCAAKRAALLAAAAAAEGQTDADQDPRVVPSDAHAMTLIAANEELRAELSNVRAELEWRLRVASKAGAWLAAEMPSMHQEHCGSTNWSGVEDKSRTPHKASAGDAGSPAVTPVAGPSRCEPVVAHERKRLEFDAELEFELKPWLAQVRLEHQLPQFLAVLGCNSSRIHHAAARQTMSQTEPNAVAVHTHMNVLHRSPPFTTVYAVGHARRLTTSWICPWSRWMHCGWYGPLALCELKAGHNRLSTLIIVTAVVTRLHTYTTFCLQARAERRRFLRAVRALTPDRENGMGDKAAVADAADVCQGVPPALLATRQQLHSACATDVQRVWRGAMGRRRAWARRTAVPGPAISVGARQDVCPAATWVLPVSGEPHVANRSEGCANTSGACTRIGGGHGPLPLAVSPANSGRRNSLGACSARRSSLGCISISTGICGGGGDGGGGQASLPIQAASIAVESFLSQTCGDLEDLM